MEGKADGETSERAGATPKILLMIDEAHRTQYKLLGANLERATPQAARVAYTGTPIDRTETTFGDYIDKYTMRQSIADGTTLESPPSDRSKSSKRLVRSRSQPAQSTIFGCLTRVIQFVRFRPIGVSHNEQPLNVCCVVQFKNRTWQEFPKTAPSASAELMTGWKFRSRAEN